MVSHEHHHQHDREQLIHWLRFHLALLGHAEVGDELLYRLGGPERALNLSCRDLASLPEITPALRTRLRDSGRLAAARDELESSLRDGLHVVHCRAPGWPDNLRTLGGMPFVLFVRGEMTAADSLALGVVGSRRPSPHGLRQAERFAAGLARQGITVVSGLARGIDAASHRAALAAGGRTIAVLGSGLGRIYPPEHRDLAGEIARKGAVISEFPGNTPPRPFHFPHRNRILSGLSRGILVVEAGEKSGSLITATWALEQDREVFALPGRVDAPEARGSLRLLQDGARLVIDPEEIPGYLGCAVTIPAPVEKDSPGRASLPGHLAPLFAEEDSWHVDRIVERLGRPPGEVLGELSRLEAEGFLARPPGGAYVLGRRSYWPFR